MSTLGHEAFTMFEEGKTFLLVVYVVATALIVFLGIFAAKISVNAISTHVGYNQFKLQFVTNSIYASRHNKLILTNYLRKIIHASLGMQTMATVATQNLVKLAVVGDGGVGKSTLISRLATGEFIDKNMTIGFDVESWTITTNSDSESIKVACFDFGGQKQFRFFQGSLIIGAKAALIVFDCNSYLSLMKIREWMDLLVGVPNDKRLLVGTKLDMGSGIPHEDIQEIANEYGIEYILISSKTGKNFDYLTSRLKDMCCELDTESDES